MLITPETVLRRGDDVLASDVGDDVVMMDLEKGAYYGLQAVGARVWSCLEQPVAVKTICARLMGEYEVDETSCFRDVTGFLDQLLEEGLVTVVN